MARVIVTEPAKQDVRDILTDLSERAGYGVASRYAADFKAAYRGLAQFPGSGPPRRALGAYARIKIVYPYVIIYARIKIVYPYVIIYDHEANNATVLRVLHGRRDITIQLIKR
jgi:plasmid stabilization system protein ParE